VTIIVQSHASLEIEGDVSASGIVTEGSKYDSSDDKDTALWINGINNDGATVYEGEPRITFPVFDYAKYKEDAIASSDGSYFNGDQTFSNRTFSPANGVVYVDGNVTISGTCNFNGGIVADNINITGTLNQIKAGDRNIIIAKSGDILISGRLEAEEALVYAEQDISTHEKWGAAVYVSGCMLAKRDIKMWNTRTDLEYVHIYMAPEAMEEGGIEILSWNE
jgi:hypothetical protein